MSIEQDRGTGIPGYDFVPQATGQASSTSPVKSQHAEALANVKAEVEAANQPSDFEAMFAAMNPMSTSQPEAARHLSDIQGSLKPSKGMSLHMHIGQRVVDRLCGEDGQFQALLEEDGFRIPGEDGYQLTIPGSRIYNLRFIVYHNAFDDFGPIIPTLEMQIRHGESSPRGPGRQQLRLPLLKGDLPKLV